MWGSPDLAGSGENNFHPIVHLPEEYWVLNLQKPQTQWNQHYEFTIGRYDEDRKGMYTQALFGGERTIHVGLDIGGRLKHRSMLSKMASFTVLPTMMSMVPTAQRSSPNTNFSSKEKNKRFGFSMAICRVNRWTIWSLAIASKKVIKSERWVMSMRMGDGLLMSIFNCLLSNRRCLIWKALLLLNIGKMPSNDIPIQGISLDAYIEASSER